MQLIFVYCLDGGSGLVAKSCPTLVTPWTVACHAPLSYELLICLVVIALNRVLKIYYEVMLSLKATFQFSFLILTIHTHTRTHIYVCIYIYIFFFFSFSLSYCTEWELHHSICRTIENKQT